MTDFSKPQLQSRLGIFLIFGSALYKALRGLWPLGAYLLFGKIDRETSTYILIGIVLLFVLIFIFSVLSYLRFRFYIDADNREFILNKGVFTTSQLTIPFDKIQQVYFKRSILQRIVNVYEVVIDTAGSKSQEVRIKALSKSDANTLQEILMQPAGYKVHRYATAANDNGAPIQKHSTEKPIWKYHLSIGTLIRLGLSTSYLRGIWVLLLFVASLLQQVDVNLMGDDYTSRIETFYTDYINFNYLSEIFLISLPIIFFAGIIITTVEVFIKYYGLCLTPTTDTIELEMGLRTQTRVSLKPRRVQIFSILTNPVQQWLGLYEVQLSLASSMDRAAKSKVKIPGLQIDIVGRVQGFLYPSKIGENFAVFKPNILLFHRKCLFSFFPLVLGLGLWYLFLDIFSWKVALPVVLVYFALAIPYQWYFFRSITFSFTENFFIRNMGIWVRKTEIVPLFKLQGITVKQPIWYKNRDLYNLTFHTAGGDLGIRAVESDILRYVNYAFYKVESSREAWM